MKNPYKSLTLILPMLVAVLSVLTASLTTAEPASPKNQAQPVESDMHEFMEYLFQPTYNRLKPLMAGAPSNNAGWKGIKADSLTLAEGGNLLLSRVPDEDSEKWLEWSVAVRATGGDLYQAAKKKDFAAARKHYEAMLTKCNACHTHFAEGEHQLSP